MPCSAHGIQLVVNTAIINARDRDKLDDIDRDVMK